MPAGARVLVYHPDWSRGRRIADTLGRAGLSTYHTSSPANCLEHLRYGSWDVGVVGSADADAAYVSRRVLLEEIGTPLVLLEDRSGALLADPQLVDAVVSAASSSPNGRRRGEALTLGPLLVDPARQDVYVDGRASQLPRGHFKLLYLLALASPDPVDRKTLCLRLGLDPDRDSLRRIDVAVARIRKRLHNLVDTRCITTLHGIGYAFGFPDVTAAGNHRSPATDTTRQPSRSPCTEEVT
jgi:DNA-binding winged helix-turn-helix (wHTH) protein